MKHHYKNFNITLGNHFIFDIEIQKEKVMVLPSFNLFELGVQKKLQSKLYFLSGSTTSLFNVGECVTTNFNIRIFDESYEDKRVLRVKYPSDNESYFYSTNENFTVFFNPETNVKALKSIENSKTKFTFINSDEDEITYTMGLFGGAIEEPVIYNFKNSITYIVNSNGIISSLENENFNGPKVTTIKNADNTIKTFEIYKTKYIDNVENKKDTISIEYINQRISKITISDFTGKIDTYNISFSSLEQWTFEHLESNKYITFNFDSNGNLVSYIYDDIGSFNSSYVVNFQYLNNGIKILNENQNEWKNIFFDSNGNFSYEFDNKGYISFKEYEHFNKDFFKKAVSNVYNLNNLSFKNLLTGNFSNQLFDEWTFNSGGTGTYSSINSSLGNDFDIFTNGLGTKVSLSMGSSSCTLSTNIVTNFSNKKYILSGFYKFTNIGSENSYFIYLKGKKNNAFTGENIYISLETGEINEINFFMKEIFFEKDTDSAELTIEIYRGTIIELYSFSLIEEIFGSIYFYNDKGILFKTINGFDITRIKFSETHLRELAFYNVNIKNDDKKIDNNYIITTSYLSSSFKTISKYNKNNGTLSSVEQIFRDDVEKMIETSQYSNEGLLLEHINSQGNKFKNEYYLNTDLKTKERFYKNLNSNQELLLNSKTYSFNSNIFLVSSNTFGYTTIYKNNFGSKMEDFIEFNSLQYRLVYNDDENLITALYNNLPFISCTYQKGSYSSDKYTKNVALNIDSVGYNNTYNAKDFIFEIKYMGSPIFSFEYNNFDDVTKINLIESNKSYNFYYSEKDELKKITTQNCTIEANREHNRLISVNEFYNFIQSTSFKQKYENNNSAIINNLIASLKEKPYYVGFFDSLVDPNDSNEDIRYFKLVKKYYESDDFINLSIGSNTMPPYLYSYKNLNFMRLKNLDFCSFNKIHSVKNGEISGTIGFSFNINAMLTDQQNLIDFSIFNYLVHTYFIGPQKKVYISIKAPNAIPIIVSLNIDLAIEDLNNVCLTFLVNQNKLKIQLYFNGKVLTNEINGNFTITDALVNFQIFYPLDLGIEYNNNYFLGCFIYNNYRLSLQEIFKYFSIIKRIENLNTIFGENYDYCPNGGGAAYYINSSNLFTRIHLKDSLRDSKGNYPITNFGYDNPFIFHLMTLGNCYYAYGNQLVYKTNLCSKGGVSFKTKLFKISTESTYFSLINENFQIRLFVNENYEVLIGFNNETFVLVRQLSLDDLTVEHTVTFSYKIESNAITYNVQFNNGPIITNEIIFGSNIDTSPFDLYIGCDGLTKTNIDIDGSQIKIQKNNFDGIFSDVLYSNTYESLNYGTSTLKSYNSPIISDYFNDIFNREYQNRIVFNELTEDHKAVILNKKYDYSKDGNLTSNRLVKEKILICNNIDDFSNSLDRSITYEYDDFNRIIKIIEKVNEIDNVFDEKIEYTYSYNDKSFLIHSNIKKIMNNNGQNLIEYNYDLNYQYNNTGDMIINNATHNSSTYTKTFYYNTGIAHQLSKVGSDNLVYNGFYLNEIRSANGQIKQKFNYRGTKLTNFQNFQNNTNLNFYYDHTGRRITKSDVINNKNVDYYYDFDGRLICEIHPDYALNFLYDEKGRLFSMIYSAYLISSQYFYIRNALNDICEVINKNGETVAKYVYDPFGKLLEVSGTNENNILNLNPFRYRSYYYDVETGLFMMGHRYYSPELCRFIQPDDIEYLDPSSINGLNLYCYCHNNPIMYYDPTGHLAISIGLLIAGLFIGTLVGAASSIVTQGLTEGRDNINLWQVLLDGTIGGISGLLAFSGIGAFGSAMISGGLGFVGSAGGDLIRNNGDWSKVNWGKAAIMAGMNFLLGWGPGVQNSQAIGKSLSSALSNNTGFKAISKVLSNPKASARGIQGVFNRYAKTLAQGISSALPDIMISRMNSAFSVMLSTAVSTTLFSWGTDYFELL